MSRHPYIFDKVHDCLITKLMWLRMSTHKFSLLLILFSYMTFWHFHRILITFNLIDFYT